MRATKPKRKTGRPPVRREALLELLRRQIVSGRAAPGTKLPSRAALMAAHCISSITVQRTFDQLREDGFIVSRGKGGTWVSEHPPHLCRYGLAFASHPGDGMHWRGLDRALSRAAAEADPDAPWSWAEYFDTDQTHESSSLQRVADDVAAGRLTGIISASGGTALLGMLRRQFPDLPLVTVSSDVADVEVPSVLLDLRSFFREALDGLDKRRRRRVAILTGVRYPQAVLKSVLANEVPKRGMQVEPYWVQQIALTDPVTARGVMHLMMQGNARARPNALIVADDNLTEQALAGIADAGARIPRDIAVVSEANFPLPRSAGRPVHRIGFSSAEILHACRTLVDRQRSGGAKKREPERLTIAATHDPGSSVAARRCRSTSA